MNTNNTCNLPADAKANLITMGFATRQINKAEQNIQIRKKTGKISLEEILEEILANGGFPQEKADVSKPFSSKSEKFETATRDIFKIQKQEGPFDLFGEDSDDDLKEILLKPVKYCQKQHQKCEKIENSATKTTECSEKDSRNLCVICMNRERAIVYLPCSHLLTCTVCGPLLKQCPICTQSVTQCMKIYWS